MKVSGHSGICGCCDCQQGNIPVRLYNAVGEVFGSEAVITGDNTAVQILDFECCIPAQYQDLPQEPMGLPPAHNYSGFRIHTIPDFEPPYRLQY
jgi:hypothetical protein